MNIFSSKVRTTGSRFIGFILLVFLAGNLSYWHVNSPLLEHVLWLVGWFFVGLGSMGRIWCSLYIAGFKNQKLVVLGPYSICRNPLYLFSYIGGMGIMFLTETLLFPIFFSLAFALYYHYVIRKEERFLQQEFPEQYHVYCQRTPRFFPNFHLYVEPEAIEISPKQCRQFLGQVIWFIWLAAAVQLFEELRMTGLLPVWSISF